MFKKRLKFEKQKKNISELIKTDQLRGCRGDPNHTPGSAPCFPGGEISTGREKDSTTLPYQLVQGEHRPFDTEFPGLCSFSSSLISIVSII